MTDNSEAKAREFWLQADNKDIQTFEYLASETPCYDNDIHVIEYEVFKRLLDHANELEAQLEVHAKIFHGLQGVYAENEEAEAILNFRAFKKEAGL